MHKRLGVALLAGAVAFGPVPVLVGLAGRAVAQEPPSAPTPSEARSNDSGSKSMGGGSMSSGKMSMKKHKKKKHM